MKDGFIKVAAGSPELKIADCVYNTDKITEMITEAYNKGVKLLVLPELCITGYTCSDLFFQNRLLESATDGLFRIKEFCTSLDMIVIAGLPIKWFNKIYNCAAVLYNGKILGIVPKSFLPNYNEFYEARQFTPAFENNTSITLRNETVPFGTKLIFRCIELPSFKLAVEICEDLWVPNPPSIGHSLAGAVIIANLSAGNEIIGKGSYRRELVNGQSARLRCGYVYSGAGTGESTGDAVYSAHCIISENGYLLSESELFSEGLTINEIDLQRLDLERRKLNCFNSEENSGYNYIDFSMAPIDTCLTRTISSAPFVPKQDKEKSARCDFILKMQALGLKKRLEHTGINKIVIGVSGGLDSCLALIAAAYAFDLMSNPRKNIKAVTMPCFGTTGRTKSNAVNLSRIIGAELIEINISNSVLQHLKDIGHSPDSRDVTYENAQARERTQILMDLANKYNALVVGTGDLSEIALGWSTYNGDHMSMYALNASVPKTLVRYVIQYSSDSSSNQEYKDVLNDILNTPVSPELIPGESSADITQRTEDIIGPYELHDFFLYYCVRWAFTPSKILRLAEYSFQDKYDRKIILKWMRLFYKRFFSQQFKRSCMPDGPKIGSVSLSPRADWRMPSDACANIWLDEIDELLNQ